MKGLSIFVDESGDFGEYSKHPPFIKKECTNQEIR